MSIEQILISAQSHNHDVRANALSYLEEQLKKDPGYLLVSLAQILADPQIQVLPRQLAGYYLKNTINNLGNTWSILNEDIKVTIKNTVLSVLADERKELRQVSGQAVAAVCKHELPIGAWPESIKILLVNSMNVNVMHKETALMTLGYICEELDEGSLCKEYADGMLTAIISGLAADEKSVTVTKVAIAALKNSVKFIKSNMINPAERSAIFEVIYKLCSHPSLEIRKLTMGVICEFANSYYDYLGSELMNLGRLTYAAMSNDEIPVAILANEFWNIIADIEIDRIEARQQCQGYIQTAASSLIAIVLQKVHIFDEIDEEDWNLHKSAASVISAVAKIIKDQVIDLVYKYIIDNITQSFWKLQKSALLVLGSILDGPSPSSLSYLIKSSLSTLLSLTQHENFQIRANSAWTISRVTQFYPDIIESSSLKPLLSTTKLIINDIPQVATHGFSIIYHLTSHKSFTNYAHPSDFEELFNKLLAICTEHSSSAFKITSFSCIDSIIQSIPNSSFPLIEAKIGLFIDLLRRSEPALQHVICSILHSAFGRASLASVTEAQADDFIVTVMSIFSNGNNVTEDAIQAIGALAECIGEKFCKYLQAVIPFVIWALDATSAPTICRSAAMCIGDLARSLNIRFATYVPHFIPKFLAILSSESIDLLIKIEVIDSLSDFASIPGVFHKHITGCLSYFESATGLCKREVSEEADPDLFDGINLLRESVLGFYISVLNSPESGFSLIGYLEHLVNFAIIMNQEHLATPAMVRAMAISMLGDIGVCFKEGCRYLLKSQAVSSVIENAWRSNEEGIRDAASFAGKIIQAL